ncbi:hypothetical protein IV203_004033 [Nitzschia inconspicua]|uniref:Uncharacterized protein n=1 Tax=Nitzschia inconspicua TaxID=303405 RepID=A0A9K3L355_9STRA|nr:hypothetical protein IV203_004033 [Nitzschia inconspicua]
MNGLAGNINPGVCSAATDFSASCGCGFSGIPTTSPAPSATPPVVPNQTPIPREPAMNQTSEPSQPESNMTIAPSGTDEATIGRSETIIPTFFLTTSPASSGPTDAPDLISQTLANASDHDANSITSTDNYTSSH